VVSFKSKPFYFTIFILAIGFLPGKDASIYVEFFEQLRASLIDAFDWRPKANFVGSRSSLSQCAPSSLS
jgi:hypothetical protein